METIREIDSGQGLVEFGEIAALARAFEVALLVPPGWAEAEAEIWVGSIVSPAR